MSRWARSGNLDLLTAILLAATYLIWFGIALFVTFTRMVDAFLFSEFRREPIERPVFIVASPRSGTTLLHRLMALDHETFVAPRLYETLFSSVTFGVWLEGFSKIDRAIGRPVGRLIDWWESTYFRGWEDIHRVSLSSHEESEGYWVMTMTSPAMAPIFFPFPDIIEKWSDIRNFGEETEAHAAAFYKEGLQALMYQRGHCRTLLNKTVLSASRLHAVRSALPDARFIVLARHPYEAIVSMCSMLSTPFLHRSESEETKRENHRVIYEMALTFYRTFAALAREPGSYVLRFDDLVAAPYDSVERIYEHLGMRLHDKAAARIRKACEESRHWESAHEYAPEDFGVTHARIHEDLRAEFEQFGFEP